MEVVEEETARAPLVVICRDRSFQRICVITPWSFKEGLSLIQVHVHAHTYTHTPGCYGVRSADCIMKRSINVGMLWVSLREILGNHVFPHTEA